MGRTFSYTGTVETWEVPPHIPGSLRIQVRGGTSGNAFPYVGSQDAGPGGGVAGIVDLAPGTVLTIAVGANGSNNTGGTGGPGGLNPLGDFNGGDGGPTNAGQPGGGGGGAATVVLVGSSIVLVGGGGGGAVNGPYGNGRSGARGGTSSASGTTGAWFGARIPGTGQTGFNAENGWGGTWTGPGQGGLGRSSLPGPPFQGSPGVGHNGGDSSMEPARGGGGGGGGYYGGGGGGQAYNQSGTGGGGSSWWDPSIVSDVADPTFPTSSVVITWRGIDGPNLGDCYTVNRTMTTNALTETYLNDNATTAAAFPTKTFTPTGLPAPTTLLSGFQLHLSTVTVMTSNGPHLMVLDPTGSTGIAGTWSGPSGVPGGTGEITLDGWDYWVTEYLTFPSSASAPQDVLTTTLGSVPGTTEFDIQVRCRAADWDAPVPGTISSAGQIISQGAFGVFNVARTTTGMWLFARYNHTTGQANTNLTCPWSSLGFTDNTWEWLRVTADVANGIRWWVGGPGAWTVVQTDPWPVDWVSWNSQADVRVGNGLLASSSLGRGFQGNISDLWVSDSVGGSQILNINLTAMTANNDATWPNSGSYGGTWTKGTGVTATGSGLGSGNPTFLFTTPMALDQFAVFLDNVAAGSYRADEWCLIYTPDTNKVSVGMLLAN